MSELLALLNEVLRLEGRALTFSAETPLLGSVPELDSMAVIDLIGALEERFVIEIGDDDLDGHTFATVGSLWAFVENKLQPA